MIYENLEIQEAEPEAPSMIETFRSIGYNVETAVADIIDNSITAGASVVKINRYWRGCDSIVTILDNGSGMSNAELINAMRPGSKNPLDERENNDLGRFGLGLKTASFSQCRKLSVISKKDGEISFWTWDLDYVEKCRKWYLVHWCPDEFKHSLDDLESGTIVIWSNMDRIVPKQIKEQNSSFKEKFSSVFEKVRNHLAMTYHRFIEDNSLQLFWGDHEIKPWNPFCVNSEKVQIFPDEYLNSNVRIKGFVLPHKLNFSSYDAYNRAEGVKGWNGQQGFYVYRGKRLLLFGDWLGLFRKEEPYKMARILIDLPNSQDGQWQIDIKKSKAIPPAIYRDQLEQYAKVVRTAAEEVFRHRGKILKLKSGHDFYPLWLDKNKDGKWSYVINRENPIISQVKIIAKEYPEQAINILLSFIESNVPIKTIYINETKSNDNESRNDIDMQILKKTMEDVYSTLLSQGNSKEQSKSLLKAIEPFNYYEDLIETL